MSVALVQYEWNIESNSFRPAISTDVQGWAAIDLRPNPAVIDGYCILTCNDSDMPNGSFIFADSPDPTQSISSNIRNQIGNYLNISLTANKFDDLLLEILYDNGNDKDPSIWNELKPTSEGRLEIWLDEQVVNLPIVSGGAQKYTDAFTRADSTNIGTDWTEVSGDWTIVSNQLNQNGSGANIWARWNTDLDTSNNYTQSTLSYTTGVSTNNHGTVCRYSSSANTGYLIYCLGTGLTYASKVVTGTKTDLTSSGWIGRYFAANDVMRVEADGSSVRTLVNSTQYNIVTDTSITSGLRGGVVAYTNGAGRVRFDNFETGDIVLLGYPRTIYYMRGA